MTSEHHRELVAQLKAMYPPGTSLIDGGRSDAPGRTAVEVRGSLGEAVLVVRFDSDPHLYGIR